MSGTNVKYLYLCFSKMTHAWWMVAIALTGVKTNYFCYCQRKTPNFCKTVYNSTTELSNLYNTPRVVG